MDREMYSIWRRPYNNNNSSSFSLLEFRINHPFQLLPSSYTPSIHTHTILYCVYLTLRRRIGTTQGLISCISCFYYSKSEICETIFTLMMMSFCCRGRSPNSELHTDTQFPVLNGVSLWKRNRREIYRPQ